MNRKWMITLLLLLNAAGSNLYSANTSNADTYINDYFNNNPITKTVSTTKLGTNLETESQNVPAFEEFPFINLALFKTPEHKLQKKIKSLICNYCFKIFSHSSARNEHERIHTGEKPYQCSLCSKTFIRSATKNEHERVHTGERPYQCSLCPKTFTQFSARSRHERIHTGKKPYQCLYCLKSFSDSSSRRLHERIHKR